MNSENTPYNSGKDLILVKSFLKKNEKDIDLKSTIDFIDYAILISCSENQIPLEELK